MRIESVRIQNFRSFKDETVFFSDYTCFVGSNGSGKSTVLNALNVFFRQYRDTRTNLSRLTEYDFHHKNIKEPIKITVTFIDLSEAAKADLSDYVRQEKLIVTSIAEYDDKLGIAEVGQWGNRLGIADFRKYFAAEKAGEKVEKLKAIYSSLREQYTDLPKANTKLAMVEALRSYEEKNKLKCTLLPSKDQFYGVSKGKNRIAKYVQWIFIAASKDITEESEESKNSALGQLLARTVRAKVNFSDKVSALRSQAQEGYQKILEDEQGVLNDISNSLQKRLEAWAHPGINAQILWKQDPERSIKVEEPWAHIKLGERGFEGELARFGHGLQRSYMLALLQELTVSDDDKAPTLIMAIEEPEIYQHPPQARYLAETLYELTEGDSQVIVCSHDPLFIPGDNFEAIRIVRECDEPSRSYITQLNYSELAALLKESEKKVLSEEGMLAKLYPSLNPVMNEMFFCRKLILTEGVEDVAYITAYLMFLKKMTEFRRLGCHIVPVGGKSEMIKPIAMAKLLSIPTYVVFDADTDKDNIESEAKRKSEVGKHKKDNKSILRLFGYDDISEWPDETIFKSDLVMWNTNLTEVIFSDLGNAWNKFFEQANAYYGQPGGLKKNPLAIARALKVAWEDGVKSKVLTKLVNDILIFANKKNVKELIPKEQSQS